MSDRTRRDIHEENKTAREDGFTRAVEIASAATILVEDTFELWFRVCLVYQFMESCIFHVPCSLSKNPILICASCLSIKLAKSNLLVSFLMMFILLPFNQIKNAHIISPFGKTLYFHYPSYNFSN